MASILPVSDYHKDANPRFLRTPYRDPTRIVQLNRWLAALCDSKGWGYLNYHDAMVDEAAAGCAKISPTTACTLTPRATRSWPPLAEQAVQAALSKPGPRRRRR